ncbi:MAG TPA: membrane protein insertase YidC [Candidatus Avipropionibacterium avicola]|uniref:Membrane protein insertase YidC n=1 Tax=Candidatus Avipropionibacterium avicola TaxID=2840701 RepID=A0A9D1H195_9ACTN|nr:membrane protein insertase YidC [Candidatus Avipropionibacterium avicola]
MNIYEFAPIRALITAADWLVTSLSDLLTPITGADSAAVAIVLLTLIVRCLLVPVGRSQVRASAVRQRLAPKIAVLKEKYGDDREALQKNLMQLYADEKASPMAGCLPVLAQMPVLMAVYGLFVVPTIGGQPNALLDHTLFGLPLGQGLLGQLQAGAFTPATAAVYAVILVVIAVVAQASRRLLAPQPAQPSPMAEPGMPDLSAMTKVLGFLPFMTVVFAAIVPLAAALYLMTTTVWTFTERLVLTRRYGLHQPGPTAA